MPYMFTAAPKMTFMYEQLAHDKAYTYAMSFQRSICTMSVYTEAVRYQLWSAQLENGGYV